MNKYNIKLILSPYSGLKYITLLTHILKSEEWITQIKFYGAVFTVINFIPHPDALTYIKYITVVLFFHLIPNKHVTVLVFFRISNEQFLSNNSVY
jgi:hypothetical protein